MSSGAGDGRSESPGQALQQVKSKLAEYKRSHAFPNKAAQRGKPEWVDPVAGQGGDPGWSAKSENRSPNRVKPAVPSAAAAKAATSAYGDASDEIADIDTRLQALQDFLRDAKAAG